MLEIEIIKSDVSRHIQNQEFENATVALERLCILVPTDANVRNSLGVCFANLNKPAQAVQCFEEACRLGPGVFAFRINLSRALEVVQAWDRAAGSYRLANELKQESAEGLIGLARCCFMAGEAEDALHAIQVLEKLRPLSDPERLLLADILLLLDRAEQAKSISDDVTLQSPHLVQANLIRAKSQQVLGNHFEASSELLEVVRRAPRCIPAYVQLVECLKFTPEEQWVVDQMIHLAEAGDLSSREASLIKLSLAMVFDQQDRFEEAMNALNSAHGTLKSLQRAPFDRRRMTAMNDQIINLFSKTFLSAQIEGGCESNKPIFVIGWQRSGTTLIETILSNHHQVRAGGELPFWVRQVGNLVDLSVPKFHEREGKEAADRYLKKLNELDATATRITDKLPSNHQWVGLLYKLFPNARFIHARRHPVDTCISFYMNMRDGAPFVHDKGEIVYAYREYLRLMTHWRSTVPDDRLLDLDYEDLIENQESVTRRMVEFCGLGWDPDCLVPERNKRVISTASHRQARQPVNCRSVGRWRHYEPWLGEFKLLLEQAQVTQAS
jgi:tetratricopeptide (TPR) repeat protein